MSGELKAVFREEHVCLLLVNLKSANKSIASCYFFMFYVKLYTNKPKQMKRHAQVSVIIILNQPPSFFFINAQCCIQRGGGAVVYILLLFT